VGYYTGDPGFFSIVKSLAGSALGLVPGGGIVKTGLRTAGGLLQRGGGMARSAGQVAKAGILRNPRLTAAGAAGAVAAAGFGVGRMTKKQAAMAGLPFRRHRHMRVTNVKALHRALRRAHGFAKLAMRTIHLIHPKKKARFGGFKKHRRK
jgi:hypothetical protein